MELDLTDQQKQIVMNYFGVTSDQVDILTITNQDERDHLGSYVPLEQIGTHTYSCALVSPTSSGGIQVRQQTWTGDLQHDRNHPFHFRRCKL